jgi:hypothetical protein
MNEGEETDETKQREEADEISERESHEVTDQDNWMDRMSNELVTLLEKEKRKLTCSQKRKQNADFGKQDVVAGITLEKFKQLQVADPSLESTWKDVQEGNSSEATTYFNRDGLLVDEEMTDIDQFVLPVQCRESVMRTAHSIPMAGHLGRDKTTQRILQRFY